MQNPFDQFDSAPTARGPLLNPKIPDAPNPYQVQKDAAAEARAQEDQRLQREAAARERARFDSEQAERDEKQRVTGGAKSKTAETLRSNLETIDRIIKDAEDNGGWGETGNTGAIMRALPIKGTAGYSLASELETLKANNAFTGLIGLAEQGVKLTPISNDEVKLAAASVANLDPNTDHETFLRTLRGLQDKYRQTLAGLEEGDKGPADPQTAASMTQWAAGSVAPGGGGGDVAARLAAQQAGRDYRPERDEIAFAMDAPGTQTSDITAGRLPPQQEAALAAYLKARSGDPSFNPAEYQAFAKSLGVEGDLALAPELVDAVRKGEALPSGIDYSQADDAARARAEAELANRLGGEEIGINPQIDKGVSLNLSDEFYGVRGGLGELLTGGSFAEGYTKERDVERAAQRAGRDKYGVAPEIASGFLAPAGVLGQAKNVGQFVKQGAAIGALAGFGEGEGPVDSVLKAGGGATVGGVLGAGFSQAPRIVSAAQASPTVQRVSSALRRKPANVDTAVVEAGKRQNIPIRQPDARPEARNAFAVVEASPTQGPRIKATLEADKAAVQSRLDAVAGDGTRLDNFSMGETIQGAGKRYIADSGKKATSLYQRAEQAAGDVQILPVQASLAIRRNINELSASGEKGNSGLIKYLKELNDDLARDGGISIEALRATRTNMRGQISERNLTATDAERRVMQVLDAASTDIEKALRSNPDALGAFKAADGFYREKQTFIKDVVQRFTGSRNNPLSAEQAATKFQAMMRNKGDYKRFSEMTKRLEPEERADMAASIAEELGKGRNGEFTLNALANNIEKMNPRALRDLFGEDGAKALADLRVIARAKADTASGLNNSKSGVVAAGTNQFKDVILGVVGGGIAGIPGAVTGMAARGGVERLSSARAARLLLNPDFTRWLRQTPATTSPAVINRHFDRLNKLASRESVFMMDARALQEYIAREASKGTGRAAAGEQDSGDSGRK